jgi:hypothetical protein
MSPILYSHYIDIFTSILSFVFLHFCLTGYFIFFNIANADGEKAWNEQKGKGGKLLLDI